MAFPYPTPSRRLAVDLSCRRHGSFDSGWPTEKVDGTAYSEASAVQDMGVDHGGANAPMPQQLLNRADVVTGR